MKHFEDLLSKVGGSIGLAQKLSVHQLTVQRWATHGIPYKYFEKLIRLTGFSLHDLDSFNRRIKARKNERP